MFEHPVIKLILKMLAAVVASLFKWLMPLFWKVIRPDTRVGTKCIRETGEKLGKFESDSPDPKTVTERVADHTGKVLLETTQIPATVQDGIVRDGTDRLARKVRALTSKVKPSAVNNWLIEQSACYFMKDFTLSRLEAHLWKSGQHTRFGEGVMTLNAILRGNIQENTKFGRLPGCDWHNQLFTRGDAIFGMLCDERRLERAAELELALALVVTQVTSVSMEDAAHCIDHGVREGRCKLRRAIQMARESYPADEEWAWRKEIDRDLCVETGYAAFVDKLLTKLRSVLDGAKILDDADSIDQVQ